MTSKSSDRGFRPARRRATWAGASAGIVGLLALACAGEPPATEAVSITAPLEQAQTSGIPILQALAGTVRSATVSTLSPRIAGNVLQVSVSVGDRVRAGQVLVRLDDRGGRAMRDRAGSGRTQAEEAIASAASAVDAAQANASLASSTFERFSALRERGSASTQEFDEARARHLAAQAGLESARRTSAQVTARRAEATAAVSDASTLLSDSEIRSPIDGVVTARFIDPGAMASPGMPLVTVEDPAASRVEVTVPQNLVVRAGDSLTIEADGTRIEAKVSRLRPALDSITRSALVEIDLGNARLRSGTYAKVFFTTGRRDAVTIPVAAVVRRGQLASVYVLGDDGVARMRVVTLGSVASERVEILSGLDAGETFVAAAAPGLRDGITIRSAA